MGITAKLAGKRVENAPRYIHNFVSAGAKPIFYDLQYKTSGKNLYQIIIQLHHQQTE
jgi:hypothetical protein